MRFSCLRKYCWFLGGSLILVSSSGIGLTFFLIFGDPFSYDNRITFDTYTPNWEDILPALIGSVIYLLVNLGLVGGGAKQDSRACVLTWIVVTYILIALFWLWFIYNQLKHKGYIEWTKYGLKSCYFCGTSSESLVGTYGAIASLILVLSSFPVITFYSRLRKRHLELTRPGYIGSRDDFTMMHNFTPSLIH